LGSVQNQFEKWNLNFPRIKPFYAVKCFPDRQVVKTLNDLDACFDCSSQSEISLILSYDVSPDRIVYANPFKKVAHIRYAVENGVNRMTFDCIDEVKKMMSVSKDIEMIIRIAASDDSKSVFQFSKKFGVKKGQYLEILRECKELGANVIGLSFHVGTFCPLDTVFTDTVELSAQVFEIAKSVGYNFRLLDIGGGFPGNEDVIVFEDIAKSVRPLIDKLFPKEIEVIGEPGTFMVAKSVTVVTHLFSRKFVKTDESLFRHYYVDDGVYGNFQIVFIEGHIKRLPVIVSKNHYEKNVTHISTVWGQTCDSVDFISKSIPLPELNIGDWLVYDDMGAYSICLNTNFNGYQPNRVIYLNTNDDIEV